MQAWALAWWEGLSCTRMVSGIIVPAYRVDSGSEMDKLGGFLESAMERAMAARDEAPTDKNVVPLAASLRAQATLRERERRGRELLDALPAAIYTTDANG